MIIFKSSQVSRPVVSQIQKIVCEDRSSHYEAQTLYRVQLGNKQTRHIQDIDIVFTQNESKFYKR